MGDKSDSKCREERISVSVRVRPISTDENKAPAVSPWMTVDGESIYLKSSAHMADFSQTYDNVFGPEKDTEEIYEKVGRHVVDSVLEGMNGTILAYGQTASGKTFTMQGVKDSAGILPLAVQQIFDGIAAREHFQFVVEATYIEIYKEKVRDLLCDGKDNLRIRENPKSGFYVDNLTTCSITSIEDIIQLREDGEKRRHTEKTKMNLRSSRSHTVFTIKIEMRDTRVEDFAQDSHIKKKRLSNTGTVLSDTSSLLTMMETSSGVRQGQLNLVDLAGSESVRSTGAQGERLAEASDINKSLLSLSRVISVLSSNNASSAHLNWRDSKLTQVLQSSLGGNCLTSVVCCVRGEDKYVEESKSTLSFACQMKRVLNKVKVNEVSDGEGRIKKLKERMELLQKELVKSEDRNKPLEDTIARLTSLLITGGGGVKPMEDVRKRRETWCPGKKRKSVVRKQRKSIMQKMNDTDVLFEEDEKFIERSGRRSSIHPSKISIVDDDYLLEMEDEDEDEIVKERGNYTLDEFDFGGDSLLKEANDQEESSVTESEVKMPLQNIDENKMKVPVLGKKDDLSSSKIEFLKLKNKKLREASEVKEVLKFLTDKVEEKENNEILGDLKEENKSVRQQLIELKSRLKEISFSESMLKQELVKEREMYSKLVAEDSEVKELREENIKHQELIEKLTSELDEKDKGVKELEALRCEKIERLEMVNSDYEALILRNRELEISNTQSEDMYKTELDKFKLEYEEKLKAQSVIIEEKDIELQRSVSSHIELEERLGKEKMEEIENLKSKLQVEAESNQRKVEEMKSETENLKNSYSEFEKEKNEEIEKLKTELKEQIQNFNALIEEKDSVIQQLSLSNSELKERMGKENSNEIEAVKTELLEEIKNCNVLIEEKDFEIQNLLASKSELQKALVGEKNDELKEVEDKFQKDIEGYLKCIEEKDKEFQKLLENQNEIEEKLSKEKNDELEKLKIGFESQVNNLNAIIEAKDVEIQNLTTSNAEILAARTAELESLRSELERLEQSGEKSEQMLKDELELFEQEKEKLTQEKIELEKTISSASKISSSSSLQLKIDELELVLKSKEKRIESLEAHKVTYDLANKIKSLADDNKHLKREKTRFVSQCRELCVQLSCQDIDDKVSIDALLNKIKKAVYVSREQTKNDRKKFIRKYNEKKKEIHDLENRISSLEEEIKEKREENEILKGKASSLSETDELAYRRSIKELEDTLEHLMKSKEEEIRHYQDKTNNLRQELQIAFSDKYKRDDVIESGKAMLQEKEREIQELRDKAKRLKEVEKELSRREKKDDDAKVTLEFLRKENEQLMEENRELKKKSDSRGMISVPSSARKSLFSPQEQVHRSPHQDFREERTERRWQSSTPARNETAVAVVKDSSPANEQAPNCIQQ